MRLNKSFKGKKTTITAKLIIKFNTMKTLKKQIATKLIA